RLESLWRLAQLAHPNRPLQRGYARIEDRQGRTLVSSAAARDAGRLRLVFGDGPVDATVDGVERTRRGSYSAPKPDQPKLL
ncbi:MAG TPA: exodeoxyribonuclease VII large subunit, partial [Allosphingosinicella sp.]